MKQTYGTWTATAATSVALIGGALLLAPTAGAADTSNFPVPGSQPANVILDELRTMGYSVAVNGANQGGGAALSRCQVTGYHAPGWYEPSQATVYVDVLCPASD